MVTSEKWKPTKYLEILDADIIKYAEIKKKSQEGEKTTRNQIK